MTNKTETKTKDPQILMIYAPDSLENIDAENADALILGIPHFSARTRALCDLSRIEQTIKDFHDQNKPVYINLQKMLEQQELEEAKTTLKILEKAKADGYYIADEGWIEIADQIDPSIRLRKKLFFQPETLVASGQEAAFYIDQNLGAVSLAHELCLEEIKEAAKHCADLEVLVSGRYSWMESRRPLLENYFMQIEKENLYQNDHLYALKEKTREDLMPVWQDGAGTHVISALPICSYEQIAELQSAGIRRFRIDALIEGNAWAERQLKNYRRILNGETVEREKEDGSDGTYKTKTQIQK